MEAKPLEAIPEETVAPATPERVTSDVPKTKPEKAKNPGRVASGKRLAERNRLAREAKKTSRGTKTTYKYNHRCKRKCKCNKYHHRTIKQQQHKHNLPYSDSWWFDCLFFWCVLPT